MNKLVRGQLVPTVATVSTSFASYHGNGCLVTSNYLGITVYLGWKKHCVGFGFVFQGIKNESFGGAPFKL